MAVTTTVGLLAGVAVIGRWVGDPGALWPVTVGLLLAAGSSVLGFDSLQRALPTSGSALAGGLLALFAGRVALVALFGLTLYAMAPGHLAAGLLSLVGFHFVLMIVEVVLLMRSRPDRRADARPTPA